MLKQRVITAVILLPIFIALLLFLPPIPFCMFTGLFVLWGAYEWSFFMGIKQLPQVLIFPFLMVFFLILSLPLPMISVLYVASGWWFIALWLVLRYPRLSGIWSKSVFLRALMGCLVLIPCWLSLNFLRIKFGIETLLFLFVLIWGADIGAYFTGKKWGKHKLAPSVSPGKSWEGLIGALFVTLGLALGALYFSQIPYNVWPAALGVCFVTVLVSVLGDLFESMLKRNAGLKDSGRLLPGHGGVLDRIDSLTAAAPVFSLGIYWIGKFFQ